ncbi:SHOCT domain-containing protein [Agathobaculum sp. NTUH-O15-33]|uniref:SHOCT domain-containing protein n=1 Tax=Agathobaculum sp. NTUH-O15-33 TaxID=3079302 RepID=UPI002958D95D|nr:SHOCT domain-containing protein [Agathobaculum sp. NTUH-O15-33]WNX85938.1 SHOCT domain-containing protein [Agathobaculum sp. NTUH-O15-33]
MTGQSASVSPMPIMLILIVLAAIIATAIILLRKKRAVPPIGANGGEDAGGQGIAKKYPFFVDPAETPQAELGSGFIQSYLGGGAISKGFVVATQRRAYFKGKSYFKDFKGHWKKQMQEKTVDLKDITGTGYTSMRQLWMLISGISSFFWPVLLCFLFKGKGGITAVLDNIAFQYTRNLFFMVLLGLLPLGVFLALYFLKRRTLFTIEFAGGNISFNTSWYGKSEVDSFQKNLRQAMAAIKDTETSAPVAAAVHAYTAPPTATGAAKEKAEALREYAKLKEDGVITDEEFQKMKAELVPNNK